MHSYTLSVRQHERRTRTLCAYHKVRLLHDDRRRRGGPAGGRRLDRPLTRRERHDVTALIDARDVRSQRRPVDDHRRRRGAILFQRARRYPRVLGRQQVDDAGLEPQCRCWTAAGGLASIWIRAWRGRRWWWSSRCGRWRGWSDGPGPADHLNRRLATARSSARLDDGDAVADTRYRAVVVDFGDVHVIRRPDEPDRRDDVADTVERRGQEARAFAHPDGHRWRRDLHFGDVLRCQEARSEQRHCRDKTSTSHGWRMCVRLNGPVKPTCHNCADQVRPKTR